MSDIHIQTGVESILERAPEIARAVETALMTLGSYDCAVILVTGDLAFSGKADQYTHALRFLRALAKDLRSRHAELLWPIFAVPGNHDCDFGRDTELRRLAIAARPAGGTFQPETVAECRKVQSDFRSAHDEFVALNSDLPVDVLSEPDAVTNAYRVNTEGGSAVFVLANSAVLSQKVENQGQVRLPEQPPVPAHAESDELRLLAFHHPIAWFSPEHQREVRSWCEQHFDVVLLGHEHCGDTRVTVAESSPTTSCAWIDGEVLFEREGSPSAFRLVGLDTKDRLAQAFVFRSSGNAGPFAKTALSPVRLLRTKAQERSLAPLPAFRELLESVGADYQHPRVSRLRAPDLFVAPDLRRTVHAGDRTEVEDIIEDPMRLLERSGIALCLGAELAGKTTLARQLFLHAVDRSNRTPVLLDGREFQSASTDAAALAVQGAFERSYGSIQLPHYTELPPGQRVLIVDDLHKCPLGAKERWKILEHLATQHGTLLAFAGEHLAFEDPIDARSPVSETYTILELGHQKRRALVDRWMSLGEAFAKPPADRHNERVRTVRLLDQLIGKSMLPRHPALLLMLLSHLNISAGLEGDPGTFCHLYNALTSTRLSRGSLQISVKRVWLAALAGHLWDSGSDRLTVAELESWHKEFCRKKGLTLPLSEVRRELSEVGRVLEDSDSGIGFRHKYEYYLFVAESLKARCKDAHGRAAIASDLLAGLGQERSAAILLFFAFSCDGSEEILQVVQDAARSALQHEPPLSLDQVDRRAKSDIPSLSADLARSLLLDEAGEAPVGGRVESAHDMGSQPIDDEISPSEADSGDSEVAEIFRSYKLVRLMGYLLREFAAKLDLSAKTTFAREIYALGLRLGGRLVRAVHDHREGLVEFFYQRHPDLLEATAGERQERAAQFLYWATQRMIDGTMHHVATAVSQRILQATFDELKAGFESPEERLVGIAVAVESTYSFPFSDAERLAKENPGNLVLRQTLRHLAWYHLYLHEVPARVKQKLAEGYQISVKGRLQADRHDKKRKRLPG